MSVNQPSRILCLEDNPHDRELLEKMLSEEGISCGFVYATTRQEFESALVQDPFDLIISDFSLPGYDGMSALATARRVQMETPFIFVSGTIGEDRAIDSLKNGATDYVLKHRLMRLIPAVDRALREADERAECERAERAMRESEHKYRELFECLADAAFLADAKSGKIIDTNRCAETMLGCGRGACDTSG